MVCGNIFTAPRHTLLFGDCAFSPKKDYEILRLEGHLNHITGSRVMAILLNGLILPIGGASAVEGLLSTGSIPSSLSTYPILDTRISVLRT